MTQQSMCFNEDEDRKQRNIKNNTDAWREKIAQIFTENKRKWEEKRLKGREVTVYEKTV